MEEIPHMNNKLINAFILSTSLAISAGAQAYNAELANSYQTLFTQVKGGAAGKHIGLMPVSAFINDVKAGKDMVAIDIRTPAEMDVFGLTLPHSMSIAADQIFIKENLAKIPKDKPVVIVCKSGARATAIGTGLRHIGFTNVKILKGGMKSLSAYMGPKEIN